MNAVVSMGSPVVLWSSFSMAAMAQGFLILGFGMKLWVTILRASNPKAAWPGLLLLPPVGTKVN